MTETRAASSRKRKREEPAAPESTEEEEEARRAPSEAPGVGAAGEDDGGGVDRISDLPDGVLGDIISLLPTKEGARTRILASRWRNLWCSAPLNLDCSSLRDYGDEFPGVISGILSSHKGPGRRFRVCAQRVGVRADTLDTWLSSDALDNLKELGVSLGAASLSLGSAGVFLPALALPASTFRFSPKLRVFTIAYCSLPNDTIHGLHFPLLKHFELQYVGISKCSLHSLIARCPALEYLRIYESVTSCLRINSPTLRSITLRNCQNKELVIESAPCLERLIHIQPGYDLILSLPSASKLHTLVCSDSAKLVFGSVAIQGVHMDSLSTVARTLKTLSITMGTLCLDTVIEFMRCFPCLEKLYILCCSSGKSNLWRRKHRNLIKSLDIRLKTIVVQYYEGKKSDIDFVTFFVLNAIVLESMTLQVIDSGEEFLAKQRMKLQLENKASRGARFSFTTGCARSFFDFIHVPGLDLIDPSI